MLSNDIWGYLYLCVMFVIVVGIPAIIILFMYKKIYSHYVNKKLQNQSYNSDTQGGRIPDSHTGLKIVIVLLVWGSLSSIQSKLTDVKNKQYSQNEELSENLDEINDRIDEIRKINKKASMPQSMISRVDVSYGALKDDHETADFTFYISLYNLEKESNYYLTYGKEKSQIKLTESKKGILEGTAELNIFKKYSNIIFVKEDAKGNTVSEEIIPYEKWGQELSEVMGWIADEYGENVEDDDDYEDYTYELEGLYSKYLARIYPANAMATSKEDGHIEKVSVEVNADNPEIDNGSLKIVKGTLYVKEDDEIQKVDIDVEDLYTPKGYKFESKKKIKAKDVSIYYELEDTYGLVYKQVLWANGEDEEQADEDMEYGPRIYKNGEQVDYLY